MELNVAGAMGFTVVGHTVGGLIVIGPRGLIGHNDTGVTICTIGGPIGGSQGSIAESVVGFWMPIPSLSRFD